jgi:hypothetical protein
MPSNHGSGSDQSASMGRSDNETPEADASFLDDDFLSFPQEDNGDSKTSRKRSRSNSPVPQVNGKISGVSVPWFESSQTQTQTQQRQWDQGRGYSCYYEPPSLVKLHNEIVSFVKLMEPTREELEIRERMVERVTVLAERTFGKRVS